MTATLDRGAATAPVIPAAPKKRKPGFLASSNGKKTVMAATGAVMFLFLVTHMIGNLKTFSDADSFNHYAEWLRAVGYPALPKRALLTIAEVVLAVALVGHVWAAVSLARRAAKARPVKYAAKVRSQAGGYTTHIMRWGGLTILLFVIWHLLDLTFGVVNPAGGAAAPYERVVAGFDPSRWYVTIFYVAALVLLGLHLRHGLWSAFQTLGVAGSRSYRALKGAALLIAVVLVAGFLSVPFAVMIGVVK